MSYNINLGTWGSIFAVPSALVDSHIKLASESQLKVLLYILRNNDKQNSADDISKAVSVHIDEVDNAIKFWTDRGLIVSADSCCDNTDVKPDIDNNSQNNKNVAPNADKPKPAKARVPSRPQRPDSLFVASRLNSDLQLAQLMDEAQIALAKPLSSGDTATLVMLHDTDGLPCDVLALLINYCVSIGKGNMRYIERMGINWSQDGIYSIELAEEKIKQLSSGNNAWSKVSKLFGIRNIGSPTKNQIMLADCWINKWKFSDDMLLEAYERCVNTKGEYNIRYINAILDKWFKKSIFNLESLKESEQKSSTKSKKKSTSSNKQNASYDIESYENYSLFDD